jgi:hypothetical protein
MNVFIHMKILITESQYNHIITEHKFGSVKISDNLFKRRLKRAKELAVNYPNPRQFALKHKKLWNFLRNKGLLDDVFSNRKRYNEDLTDEKVRELASKYVSVSDFEVENGTAYQYALRNNLLKDLFPNNDFDPAAQGTYIGNRDESPYYNKHIQKHLDRLMYRASSQYKDMNDLKIRNPDLYKQLSNLGHDYIPSDDDVHY